MAAPAATVWSAPDPAGDPTAFLLVRPADEVDDGSLAALAQECGLQRLDAPGEIAVVDPARMLVRIRAMRATLKTPAGEVAGQRVDPEWVGNAMGRRYVLVLVGTEPLAESADPAQLSRYLSDFSVVRAGLVSLPRPRA